MNGLEKYEGYGHGSIVWSRMNGLVTGEQEEPASAHYDHWCLLVTPKIRHPKSKQSIAMLKVFHSKTFPFFMNPLQEVLLLKKVVICLFAPAH